MARRGVGFWDRFIQEASLRHWSRLARGAGTADLDALRNAQARARALARRIDAVAFTAETRLALPRIGSSAFPVPPGTDWSWRPDLWRGPLPRPGVAGVSNRTALGDQVTVFHDCPLSEIALRQIRNTGAADLSPFSVALDVFGFQGSFLSLAIDLPTAAAQGLRKRHVLRVAIQSRHERREEMFARLNIRHGPNTEQLVQEIRGDDAVAEFDLAYSDLNEKRVESLWLDLIVDRPAMNRIIFTDVTLARYPRAEV
jgi:hypothetical protein